MLIPYYQDELTEIYHADCMDILPLFPDKSVDLVLTDPPYSTPVVTSFGRKKERNFGDLAIQRGFLVLLKNLLECVLKPQAVVFIFCDKKYYSILFEVFYKWHTSQLLIWDKGRIGLGRPFRRRYELLYFLSPDSGLRIKNGKTYADILLYPSVPSSQKLHGAEKPLALCQDMISAFTEDSHIVLDPFLGSGTTLVAAKKLGRRAIGIEISEEYCEIAAKRLRETIAGEATSGSKNNGPEKISQDTE